MPSNFADDSDGWKTFLVCLATHPQDCQTHGRHTRDRTIIHPTGSKTDQIRRITESHCAADSQIAQLQASLAAATVNQALSSCELQSDAQQLVPRVRAPMPLDVAAVVAAITNDALKALQPDQLQHLARLAARTGDVLTAMMLLQCVSNFHTCILADPP